MTKIPYVTFMKHAQKVSKAASASRPILKGVIHRTEYIAVTDSHRLYYAEEMYEGEEKNVNPVTGVEITEGNYPEVRTLIPDASSAKFTAKIDVDTAYKVVKLIEQAGKVGKKTEFITFEKNGLNFAISTHSDSVVTCRYIAAESDGGDTFTMHASARYVSEAFALLKDAGLTEVTFNFFGNMRPFTFTGGNLTALILPVRTY